MAKTRINLTIDDDLLDFLKGYAETQRISVSDLLTQFVLNLKRRKENDPMEVIMADPQFNAALLETIEKIRDGSILWKRYDEVFS